MPDPAALAAAVAARVDGVERDLSDTRQDVAALGRGVSDLLAQVRRLTSGPDTTANGATPDGTGAPAGPPDDAGDGAATGEQGEDEAQEQPDWLAVADPDLAREWLREAHVWAGWALAPHGLDLAQVACWPLHPAVVSDLLALSAERARAYTDPTPTAVVEWLTRWLPAGLERIRAEVAACSQDHGHRSGRLYDATGLTSPQGLDDVAAWWTTHRDTPAPAWLHLPRLD